MENASPCCRRRAHRRRPPPARRRTVPQPPITHRATHSANHPAHRRPTRNASPLHRRSAVPSTTNFPQPREIPGAAALKSAQTSPTIEHVSYYQGGITQPSGPAHLAGTPARRHVASTRDRPSHPHFCETNPFSSPSPPTLLQSPIRGALLRSLGCQLSAEDGPAISPKEGQRFSAKRDHRFSPKLVHGAGLMP